MPLFAPLPHLPCLFHHPLCTCLVCVCQVFEALYAGKVPSAWLKAYPSLKGLGPWTRDLLARIEQLARWAEGTYPRIYWLGGFTYPTGFLTAVLQVCVCVVFVCLCLCAYVCGLGGTGQVTGMRWKLVLSVLSP